MWIWGGCCFVASHFVFILNPREVVEASESHLQDMLQQLTSVNAAKPSERALIQQGKQTAWGSFYLCETVLLDTCAQTRTFDICAQLGVNLSSKNVIPIVQ